MARGGEAAAATPERGGGAYGASRGIDGDVAPLLLGEEAGNTVVSPLNDVQGNACKLQTRAPWLPYLAGLCLECNAAIGPHTDRLD
jgi:hypothetical protein